MEHRTQDQVAKIAVTRRSPRVAGPMSKAERLDRWIELLEVDPARGLQSLKGTEFEEIEVRDKMRAEHSPISVAFEDPVLRAEGLRGDTYGNAREFFGLTDKQVHSVVCHCHSGEKMAAGTAALRVKSCVPVNKSFAQRIRCALSAWR